jgi:hypothetical protein
LDFGDAPDSFHTLLASNGARHALIESGPHLGAAFDGDLNGVPTPSADGDDLNGDDEDGVLFRGPFVAGLTTAIDVTVNKNCFFEAWIDYDGDHVFGFDEYIAGDIQGHPPFALGFAQPFALEGGVNHMSLLVRDAPFKAGPSFMRVRVSSNGGLAPFGFAPDGEVEDYQINLLDEAGPPMLTYSINAAGQLVLEFTGFLDSAPSVTGPWQRSAGQNPIAVDLRVGQIFYRASSQ